MQQKAPGRAVRGFFVTTGLGQPFFFVHLHPQAGNVTEWLGRGLQNLLRRFESARYLFLNRKTPVRQLLSRGFVLLAPALRSVLTTLLAGWLLLGSRLPARAQQPELSELAPVPTPAPPKISTALPAGKLLTPPRVELPAQVTQGLLVVEAEVDGRRGAFFLDSGAPGLLLNQREFAPPAGEVAPLTQGSRGINGGMGSFSHYLVQHFDCQGIVLNNQEVATLDMASLQRRLGVGLLLGIIGYDLLRDYALTLDYRAGRVLLQKPGAAGAVPATGVRVPFRLRGHLPVVAATIEGRPYQLGLDCGAQTNLLDPAAAVALARKLRHREQVTLRGADAAGSTAGTATVPRIILAQGQLTFRRQATTFANISHLSRVPGPVPLEGLLGYPLLSQYRTTIDYVNSEVVFERW